MRPGDTLSRIAACSGVSTADLARRNRIANPDLVFAGARLRLPEGHRCVAARSGTPAHQATPELAVDIARARGSELLHDATANLDAADFEEATSRAAACVRVLAPYGLDDDAKEIRARCHVVSGMAAAGLDRREHAIEEFRSAFALNPDLELASDSTSPRILELVSAARTRPSP